jgi:hypothetical protein
MISWPSSTMPLNRLAGFARGLFAKDVEHLFQTFDMTCGLVTVR